MRDRCAKRLLWDIEGHLVDTKSFATTARDTGRARQPGEPIHNMWLRLTVDLDMKIHDVEAVTDASPYQLCPSITPNFKKLIGITIGPGWRKKMLEHLGDARAARHHRVPGDQPRAREPPRRRSGSRRQTTVPDQCLSHV